MKKIQYFLALALLILFASCKKTTDSIQPPARLLPSISSFSPATGSAGTTVTISGKNFSPAIANDAVNFNGTAATVTSATTDQIIVTVPNGAITGKITVKISSHSSTSTNDFTVLSIPGSFSVARSGMAVAALGNKIYFGGGYDGTQADGNIDIYDVDLAKWTSATLSRPRFNFVAASAGHKVAFAGGETDLVIPAPVSDVVDIYDDSAKTWSTAHLSIPSYYLSAGSAGNKIIFGGGLDTTLLNVDIYDVVNNTWSVHTLNAPRLYSNIIGAGNKILIAGGYNINSTSNLNYFLTSVDIYDVTTDSWSQANLSVARGGIRNGIGVAALGNKIVFAGGYIIDTANNFVPSSAIDIYDAGSGAWSTSQLPVAAHYSCAASAGSKILFVRDTDISGNVSGIVDIYDVTTGIWSTSSVSEARIQIAAAAAGNKIVFAGGWNTNGFSKTVDIYDVSTGVWTH